MGINSTYAIDPDDTIESIKKTHAGTLHIGHGRRRRRHADADRTQTLRQADKEGTKTRKTLRHGRHEDTEGIRTRKAPSSIKHKDTEGMQTCRNGRH